MKVVIDRNQFRNVLGKIQGLTSRKTTLAITETVLIRTLDTGIHVTATDLEIGYEGTYPAEVETGGAIAVNARKLHDIIKDFPLERVMLHEEENRWIRIGVDSVEFHIVGMNPENFPEMPLVEDVPFFEVDGPALRRMVEKVGIVSVGPDERRAHLAGTLFEILPAPDAVPDDPEAAGEPAGPTLRMVSTDSSRMALYDFAMTSQAPLLEKGVILPKKGLAEVARFLDTDGPVQVGVKDAHLVVKKDADTLTIRLMEGEYPRYSAITGGHPDGFTVTLDRRLFLMMLRRMSILLTDRYRSVIFTFSDNRLLVSMANPDLGESKEEMAVEYDRAPLEVAFNPKFFIDALNAIEADVVTLHLVDHERACLVRGENDTAYLNVIMPMRL